MDRTDRIAKVRALYERASTPGEKEAARQALKRLGVDPDGESSRKKPSGSYTGNSFNEVASSFARFNKAMQVLFMDLTPVQRELFSMLVQQEMEKGGKPK